MYTARLRYHSSPHMEERRRNTRNLLTRKNMNGKPSEPKCQKEVGPR